jgi:hypothetical protein
MLELFHQVLSSMVDGKTPLDIFCQTWIFLFGGAAIWLVGRLENWKKWGYVVGLMGQPAWYYASLQSQQWGIMLLSIWYTYSWCQGIYNYWLKKDGMKIPKTVDDLISL